MSKVDNMAQSRLHHILMMSKKLGISNDMLIRRYVIERFLARLSMTDHYKTHVLKGAMALGAYIDNLGRPTRDVDFLGLEYGKSDVTLGIMRDILSVDLSEEDGVEFLLDTLEVEPIQKKAEENGKRVTGIAMIGRARVPLKIEVSYGYLSTPDSNLIELPTILAHSNETKLLIYSLETILAEKFQTAVEKGIGNSRMKDFFDIRAIARYRNLDAELVIKAFQNTFTSRDTAVPDAIPICYTPEFIKLKENAWKSFIKGPSGEKSTFQSVVDEIQDFTMGFAHMTLGQRDAENWIAGEGFVIPTRGFQL